MILSTLFYFSQNVCSKQVSSTIETNNEFTPGMIDVSRIQDSYVNCCKHYQKPLKISMVGKETTCYQRIKNWHHLVEGVLEDLLAETTFHYGFA